MSSNSKSKLDPWLFYCKSLESKPLITKCVTSGAICFVADLVCQIIERKEDTSIDLTRLLRFSFLGSSLVGPSLHFWYRTLSQKFPGNSLMPAVQRLAFDQLVFAPIFIPVFFSTNLLLEGRPEMIPQKIKNDWLSTVLTNYAVWVPAQFINFRFIPQLHQVLFSNIVGFFWNIYFSSAANSEKSTED